MPVSSPSYFPPQRNSDRIVGLNAGFNQTGNNVFLAGANAGAFSTLSDLIVIGDNAFSASVTAASYAGSVVIGSQSVSGILASNVGDNGPLIALGGFILSNTSARNPINGVLIGANILNTFNGSGLNTTGNVLVGNNIAPGGTFPIGAAAFARNVILGDQAIAGPGSAVQSTITDNVLIGYKSLYAISDGIYQSVVIGSNTNVNFDLAHDVTAVGYAATVNAIGGILIGSGSLINVGATDAIVIGNGLTAPGASTLLIGMNGVGNALYADMVGGNLQVGGGSTLHTFQGTNTLFLPNGTHTGTPTGGGFLYSSAGALHWVDSGGTDNTLTPVASGGGTLPGRIAFTAGAGSQNNVNPGGAWPAGIARLIVNTSAAEAWTGLVAGTDGQLVFVWNNAAIGGNTLTLNNLNAGSTAANRFSLSGASLALVPQSGVFLVYDGTSSLWFVT